MKILNINKYYKKVELIGKGAFSKVYKVIRLKDNKQYALKKVEIEMINDKEKENAFNEVKILSSLKNENIVGFIESFIDNKDKNLCIIMEYGKGGDLYDTIKFLKINKKKLSENTIKNYFYQIIIGLKILSKNKIIHRDLKCANIFLFDNMKKIKIGDFNVAKVVSLDYAQTQTGTPYYASPEVWRDENYTTKADIWSLGCIIYELCMLKPPFQGKNMNNLFKNIQKGKIDDWDKNYSKDLLNLIDKCFNINPHNRPSADELFQDEYFKIFEINKTKKINLFINKKINITNTDNKVKKKKILKSYKHNKNTSLKNTIIYNKNSDRNYKKNIYKNKINTIINQIKSNFIKTSLKNKISVSLNKKSISKSKNLINFNCPKYCIYNKKSSVEKNLKPCYSNLLKKNIKINNIRKNNSKVSILNF